MDRGAQPPCGIDTLQSPLRRIRNPIRPAPGRHLGRDVQGKRVPAAHERPRMRFRRASDTCNPGTLAPPLHHCLATSGTLCTRGPAAVHDLHCHLDPPGKSLPKPPTREQLHMSARAYPPHAAPQPAPHPVCPAEHRSQPSGAQAHEIPAATGPESRSPRCRRRAPCLRHPGHSRIRSNRRTVVL